MTAIGIPVNMTPSHPGDFIRAEIIQDLGLNVTRTAEILGVRRSTLSALLNGHLAAPLVEAETADWRSTRSYSSSSPSSTMLLGIAGSCTTPSRMRARAGEIAVEQHVRSC